MRLPRITTSRCWSWDRRSLHVKWWSAGSLLVTKSMPLQQWSTPFIARRTRRAGCDWTWQYYRHIPRQYYHFTRLLNHVSGRFWTSQWDMETFHRDLRAPLGTFFLFPISHLSPSLFLFLGLSRCIRIEPSTSFLPQPFFDIFCDLPSEESSQFNPTAVLPGPLHLLIDTSLVQQSRPWFPKWRNLRRHKCCFFVNWERPEKCWKLDFYP